MNNKNRRFLEERRNEDITHSGVNVVYKTDDLDMFQLSKFNRNVFLRKEMIEQAKQGFLSPIIVNENLTVIDGQHRLEASKEVGVPIEYVIKPGLNEDDIVRMNTVQKPWSLKNYIEAYANRGLEEFIKLFKLIEKGYSNVTVTTSISVNSSTDTHRANKSIKEGTFEFFNYEKAVEFLQYYKRLREETRTKKRTTVATALYELFKIKGFDRNRMIEKIKQTGLDEDINIKTFIHTDILKTLINAYNKGLGKQSSKYIDYHISSVGNLIIDQEKEEWAKEKTASDSDQ